MNISLNEFLNIPDALDAVATRTTSLLTINLKTRKLIGTSRETLKDLKIGPKMLAKRSYACWATDEEARQLSGSIMMAKSVRLQAEYMGTRKIRVCMGCPRTGWGLFCEIWTDRR